MNRRQFIETTVLATVFPFEMAADTGYWDFDGVRVSGEIVFLRYDGTGKPVGECVIDGEVGSWELRKSVWGGEIRYDEFSDRAKALDEAVEFMQDT